MSGVEIIKTGLLVTKKKKKIMVKSVSEKKKYIMCNIEA